DGESRLGDFREVVDKLYKISYIDNVQCSETKLIELRGEISSARRVFYLTLNKAFMDEEK
ncbi:MAG: hypothetical protein O9262_00920, partial [Cyclobacteriaceae bacterium]|nr:hypothetical protein [Cyclobacteriaceae bacterium]